MTIFDIISKAQTALGLLGIVKPFLGEHGNLVDIATDVIGRALSGATLGVEVYGQLAEELDGVIAELTAIKERGGVAGDDFRDEIAAIRARGETLDSIKARLEG